MSGSTNTAVTETVSKSPEANFVLGAVINQLGITHDQIIAALLREGASLEEHTKFLEGEVDKTVGVAKRNFITAKELQDQLGEEKMATKRLHTQIKFMHKYHGSDAEKAMRSLPLGQVDLCMIFIRKFRGIERYNFSQDAKGGTHLLVTVSENNRNSIQISTPKKGDSFYMLITDNSETFAFGRNKKGLYMKDGKTGKEESISGDDFYNQMRRIFALEPSAK